MELQKNESNKGKDHMFRYNFDEIEIYVSY